MARTILIEASPLVLATGAAYDIRLAGGGRLAYKHRGRNDWLAGVVKEPRFSAKMEFNQNGFAGGARVSSATLEYAPSARSTLNLIEDYLWQETPIEVLVGDDEAVGGPVWTTLIKGRVTEQSVQDGVVRFTIRDASSDLDNPVTDASFLGTGGIEGDAAVLERVKRRTWGRAFNVEARMLLSATNIHEVGDPAFPLSSIDIVRDKGRSASSLTTVAWQGSIAATLAALQAASAPQGGGVIAPSIACIKWWTQPAGPLTADIKGEVGTGYVETAAAIAERIVASQSSLSISNVAAMVTARPDACGIHIEDTGETSAQALDRLLKGVSLMWNANPSGIIDLSEIKLTGSVETVTIHKADRTRHFRPVRTQRVGYQRNQRRHADSEISAAVTYDDGTDINAVQPAESGATNDANLDNVNILTINEKRTKLIPDEDERQGRYTVLLARGSAIVAFGANATVSSAMSAATTARSNWIAYRDAIPGGWNVTSVHSTIVRITFDSWDVAYDSALELLFKAVSEADATGGVVGGPMFVDTLGNPWNADNGATTDDNMILNAGQATNSLGWIFSGSPALITPSGFTTSSTYAGGTGGAYNGLTSAGAGMRDGVYIGNASVHATNANATAHVTMNLGSVKALGDLYTAPIPASFDSWGATWLNPVAVRLSNDNVSYTTVIGALTGHADNVTKVTSLLGNSAQYIRLERSATFLGVSEFYVFDTGGGIVASRVAASTGETVPAWSNFPASGATLAIPNYGVKLPTLSAAKLFLSGKSIKSTGATGVLTVTVKWWKNDGTASSIAASTATVVTPSVDNVETPFSLPLAVPSDANKWTLEESRTSGTGTMKIGAIRLSKTELAADVTSSIEGPSDRTISADYTGAILTALPASIAYKFLYNGVDVTSGTTFSAAVITGTNISASFSGANLQVNNSGGNMTSALIEITATYGLTTPRKMQMRINVERGSAPATGGGGSGGGGSQSADYAGTTTTTSLAAISATEIEVTVGSGGIVDLYTSYEYTTALLSGSQNVSAQFYEWNGSAWVAIGSETTSSTTYVGANGDPGTGSITYQRTGLTPGSTKRFKVYGKNTGGSTGAARNWSGTISGVGS